jgi:hypothetical protein
MKVVLDVEDVNMKNMFISLESVIQYESCDVKYTVSSSILPKHQNRHTSYLHRNGEVTVNNHEKNLDF